MIFSVFVEYSAQMGNPSTSHTERGHMTGRGAPSSKGDLSQDMSVVSGTAAQPDITPAGHRAIPIRGGD